MRALGWIRDRFDPRDAQHAFSTVRGKLATPAAAASVKDRVVCILDQEHAGTCVSFAGMQAIRVAHVGELLPVTGDLTAAKDQSKLGSILWGYWFARAPIHMTAEDSGCQIRDFFAGVSKVGFPPEELWPYSDSHKPDAPMFKFPSKTAWRAAYDQRGGVGYRRIDSLGDERISDVQTAITNGHAVVAGWDVSEQFCDPDSDPGSSLVPPLSDTDKVAGGHAMTIVGYDQNELCICNSWGLGFAMDGFFRATYDWILQCEDPWIVEASPLYSETP